MTPAERTEMWSRNAKFLRVMSVWVAVLGCLWALWALWVSVYAAIQAEEVLLVLPGVISAVQILVGAFFILALGRCIAAIAEMIWFGLPDSAK
ncbi:MAG: hypothetical protein AAF333_16635 [Planctomycetota bacterium]